MGANKAILALPLSVSHYVMEEDLLSDSEPSRLLPLLSYFFLPVSRARKINLSIPDTVGMTLMPCEGCRRKGLGSTLTG